MRFRQNKILAFLPPQARRRLYLAMTENFAAQQVLQTQVQDQFVFIP